MGSRVSEEALRTGLAVVSVSRSGAPPKGVSAPWVGKVKWAKVRRRRRQQDSDLVQGNYIWHWG